MKHDYPIPAFTTHVATIFQDRMELQDALRAHDWDVGRASSAFESPKKPQPSKHTTAKSKNQKQRKIYDKRHGRSFDALNQKSVVSPLVGYNSRSARCTSNE